MLISEDTLRYKGTVFGVFKAANNTDSSSKGEWPPGIYKPEGLVEVTGDNSLANGKYGRWFLGFKDFGDRAGMGIHAGRFARPDRAGREGYQHATMGCIRTTEEAMEFIADQYEADPISELWVRD